MATTTRLNLYFFAIQLHNILKQIFKFNNQQNFTFTKNVRIFNIWNKMEFLLLDVQST